MNKDTNSIVADQMIDTNNKVELIGITKKKQKWDKILHKEHIRL